MKKIVAMLLVVVMLGGISVSAASDGELKIQLTSASISDNEEIRGYLVSYQEDVLVIEMDEKEYSVYAPEDKFGEELLNLKARDHLVLAVSHGEITYILEEIIQINVLMDGGEPIPVLYEEKNALNDNFLVKYLETTINYDVEAEIINDVVMLPLRNTLEAMGYKVTWNPETLSVDINKGAQFTTIYIGKNSYFKNKMAPRELSSEPVVIEGRTLVPAEFFYVILGHGLQIEEGNITFNDEMMAIHSGYVQEVQYDETGSMHITISSKEVSEEIYDTTIIHTSSQYTYFNTEVKEGAFINVICPPIMTMSIPGQTSGYIIY